MFSAIAQWLFPLVVIISAAGVTSRPERGKDYTR